MRNFFEKCIDTLDKIFSILEKCVIPVIILLFFIVVLKILGYDIPLQVLGIKIDIYDLLIIIASLIIAWTGEKIIDKLIYNQMDKSRDEDRKYLIKELEEEHSPALNIDESEESETADVKKKNG